MDEDIYNNLTEEQRKEYDKGEAIALIQADECQGRTFEEADLQGEFD